jgi:hypothetical protein
MVRFGEQPGRDEGDELSLGFQGRLAVKCEADAVGDTEDMGVYGHCGDVMDDSGNDVSRLAAYSGEALQGGKVCGYLAVELADEHLCHSDQVAGLVVGVRDGADIGIDLIGRGSGESTGGGEGIEKSGCDGIDPFVGTLCRQDDGNEELESVVMAELRFCYRHVFFKPA